MNKFEATYARWVIRNRLLIILVCLAGVAALTYGAGKLRFDTSYRVFFSDDNPELLAFENVENTYVKDDNVVVIVAPRGGDVFTRETLAAVEELTAALWQVPYANRVDSITNFQYTEAEDDDIIVRDMVTDAHSLSDDALARARAAVLAEPALLKRLVSEHGHVTGINVTVQMSTDERARATQIIVEFVRDVIANFKQRHAQIDIYLSGMVMMDQAFFEVSMDDSTKLVPTAFVLMMGLIAFLVGGVFGTLVTLLVIAFSIAAAMGAGGYLDFPLTGISISAPIIILTVAVANCVHVLVTFIHGLRQGERRLEAMEESLRVNRSRCFSPARRPRSAFRP